MTTLPKPKHPLVVVYSNMYARCYKPKSDGYAWYGERGITVCSEWLADMKEFIRWAYANGWKPGLEIDRKDTDGPCSPDNCRFVTHLENCLNRSNTHFIEAFGERKARSEWPKDPRCKCSYWTLIKRLATGMDPEKAISTPTRGAT